MQLWAPSIRNHIWFCAKNCKNNVKNFKASHYYRNLKNLLQTVVIVECRVYKYTLFQHFNKYKFVFCFYCKGYVDWYTPSCG